MHDQLHLIKLNVDPIRLHSAARQQRWARGPGAFIDHELHALLAATFGKGSVQPFSVDRVQDRSLTVLAYSDRPLHILKSEAQQTSEPDWFECIRWESAHSKPMPTSWVRGTRLGFRVRCCPVVRNREGQGGRAREEDVFLFVGRRTEGALDRYDVYIDWLKRQLSANDAVQVETARVERYQRTMMLRRSQSERRQSKRLERPDVVFEGTFTIGEAQAFHDLLARGVGRHRAYGFGLLLLRRP